LEEEALEKVGLHTLEANPVPLQAVHGLLEERLAGGGHTRDVILIPLNGRVDVLEDFLDRVRDLCTDTVSGDEGDLLEGMKSCDGMIRKCNQQYTLHRISSRATKRRSLYMNDCIIEMAHPIRQTGEGGREGGCLALWICYETKKDKTAVGIRRYKPTGRPVDGKRMQGRCGTWSGRWSAVVEKSKRKKRMTVPGANSDGQNWQTRDSKARNEHVHRSKFKIIVR
jgi:hypothetical protein